MAERDENSYVGEKVLFETRPRFTLNLGSTIVKFIVLLLLLYFFSTILSLFASLQEFLIYYVQIPLVQGVSYLLLFIVVCSGVFYTMGCYLLEGHPLHAYHP